MNFIQKIKHDRSILLSLSIGIAYIWFGALKFVPQLSPAEDVAGETISLLTFHAVPNDISLLILAIIETVIGLFLLFNVRHRVVIISAIVHMLCTFTPLFLMSDQCFDKHFYDLSLLGQYIIKNLVILSALIVLMPSPNNHPKEIKSSTL